MEQEREREQELERGLGWLLKEDVWKRSGEVFGST